MNNKVTSVIYGSVMALMIAVAYLVAADILLPENIMLVAALVMASMAAIIADMKYLKRRKKSCCEFATA